MGNGTSNSFGARSEISFAGGKAAYFRLARLAEAGVGDVSRLPVSIRLLLETLLRGENGREVTTDDVAALAKYDPAAPGTIDVPFHPARVLMQDFTGVPCIVDLAAMRDAMERLGGDPARINPLIPVDLVIDHSVQVDAYASPEALPRNAELEFSRNRERYEFLRWAQTAFSRFRVVPPASGICHQVNLEHLAAVVDLRTVAGVPVAFPDSCVGTDSHTPMVNGAGVLGWGVGGIEAEAAMLGQAVRAARKQQMPTWGIAFGGYIARLKRVACSKRGAQHRNEHGCRARCIREEGRGIILFERLFLALSQAVCNCFGA